MKYLDVKVVVISSYHDTLIRAGEGVGDAWRAVGSDITLALEKFKISTTALEKSENPKLDL